MPRFSCSCHKLNLAIKHAINNQKYLLEIIKKLNESNSTIRNTIMINRIFRDLKCRPKLDNKTRWSSALLLLLSVKRAYDKGAFNDDIVCPVSLDLIETYIQILLPAYKLSVMWQKNNSSIADVIPNILSLINKWEKFDVDQEAKELCLFLIHFVREKFKYEFKSEIYKVYF